ncbi:hypothetical protein K2O51_31195 (plasmid) [Cupriavidus pinatubonensis]|uniref:hypothetical protein n=1 Tax=Cupriavidus pinatubonensis TaxID=248026 RepID=UPI001C7394D8|nr:hypothetical protein [Cupriavidus pinatubonensis]QYY33712.1 hypothetical protein K2O51_31195 [Cupriavidus pinatubonensis]
MTTVFENHGMACPNCGDDNCLNVEIQSVARLLPTGTDIVGDQEWSDRSHVICDACGHEGPVSKFSGRKAKMARQLRSLRDLIDRTMWDHVYQESEGILPGPDCEYTAALASIDALLADGKGTHLVAGA